MNNNILPVSNYYIRKQLKIEYTAGICNIDLPIKTGKMCKCSWTTVDSDDEKTNQELLDLRRRYEQLLLKTSPAITIYENGQWTKGVFQYKYKTLVDDLIYTNTNSPHLVVLNDTYTGTVLTSKKDIIRIVKIDVRQSI